MSTPDMSPPETPQTPLPSSFENPNNRNFLKDVVEPADSQYGRNAGQVPTRERDKLLRRLSGNQYYKEDRPVRSGAWAAAKAAVSAGDSRALSDAVAADQVRRRAGTPWAEQVGQVATANLFQPLAQPVSDPEATAPTVPIMPSVRSTAEPKWPTVDRDAQSFKNLASLFGRRSDGQKTVRFAPVDTEPKLDKNPFEFASVSGKLDPETMYRTTRNSNMARELSRTIEATAATSADAEEPKWVADERSLLRQESPTDVMHPVHNSVRGRMAKVGRAVLGFVSGRRTQRKPSHQAPPSRPGSFRY